MKHIVLHGDDFLKIKDRLSSFIAEARRRGWSIERVGAQARMNVSEAVSGSSLFSQGKLVIVENMRLMTPKQLTRLAEIDVPETTVVFVSEGYLSSGILRSLPEKTKVEVYKLPKEVFKLLDALYPNNAKSSIFLLKSVLKKEPIERVFAMVARHVRDLFWLENDPNAVPYPQAWRVGKIRSQARKFKEGQLPRLVSLLVEADINAKTSAKSFADSLDQIILGELE